METSEVSPIINPLKNRTAVQTLVICRNSQTSNQLRAALKTMGFSRLTACGTHVSGLERMKVRNFQLIMFDAAYIDMPVSEFVAQSIALDKTAIMIAISAEPKIDDVFSLLKSGARAFIITPYTLEGMEAIIVRAGEGPPFSESVLQAPDRNAALSGVVLNNLYRLSVLMRQAREFQSALKEVQFYKCALSESVELARLFCEGGNEEILRDRFMEDCCCRADSASSRLGRMRQKLQRDRGKDEGGAEMSIAK